MRESRKPEFRDTFMSDVLALVALLALFGASWVVLPILGELLHDPRPGLWVRP